MHRSFYIICILIIQKFIYLFIYLYFMRDTVLVPILKCLFKVMTHCFFMRDTVPVPI